MNRFLGLALCVFILSSPALAEVFTKNTKILKYKLSLDKAVNLQLNFKFSDSEALSGSDRRPMVLLFDEKGGGTTYDKSNPAGFMFLRHRLDSKTKDTINIYAPLKAGNYILYLVGRKYLNKPFDFSITKISGHFEQEPNDKESEATQLTEKSFYSAYALQRRSRDADFYKIIIKENGVLDLVFKTDKTCVDSKGYEVTLMESETTRKKEYDMLMRVFRTNEDFRKTIGLRKGEYIVKVHSYGDCVKNKKYSLAYLERPTQYTELEPNDKSTMATEIKTDGIYHNGRLHAKQGSEYDYFSFELLESQEILIAFKLPYFETEERGGKIRSKTDFTIQLYDEANDRIDYFTPREQITKYSPKKGTLAKGKYYLRVNSLRDARGSKNTEYAITVILNSNEWH